MTTRSNCLVGHARTRSPWRCWQRTVSSITHGTPSSLTAPTALGDMRRTELPQPCSLPMLPLVHLTLTPSTPLPRCWCIGSACHHHCGCPAADCPRRRLQATSQPPQHRPQPRATTSDRCCCDERACTCSQSPAPTPTSTPEPSTAQSFGYQAPPMPASAPSLSGTVAHASLHVLHSLLFEFLSVSVYMPAPYTVATATARVRDSWGAFTIFASRVLGPTAMALPDERRLGRACLGAAHPRTPAGRSCPRSGYALVPCHDLPCKSCCRLSPITRLDSFLPDSSSTPRTLSAPSTSLSQRTAPTLPASCSRPARSPVPMRP